MKKRRKDGEIVPNAAATENPNHPTEIEVVRKRPFYLKMY